MLSFWLPNTHLQAFACTGLSVHVPSAPVYRNQDRGSSSSLLLVAITHQCPASSCPIHIYISVHYPGQCASPLCTCAQCSNAPVSTVNRQAGSYEARRRPSAAANLYGQFLRYLPLVTKTNNCGETEKNIGLTCILLQTRIKELQNK